jgi:hypothetical protein
MRNCQFFKILAVLLLIACNNAAGQKDQTYYDRINARREQFRQELRTMPREQIQAKLRSMRAAVGSVITYESDYCLFLDALGEEEEVAATVLEDVIPLIDLRIPMHNTESAFGVLDICPAARIFVGQRRAALPLVEKTLTRKDISAWTRLLLEHVRRSIDRRPGDPFPMALRNDTDLGDLDPAVNRELTPREKSNRKFAEQKKATAANSDPEQPNATLSIATTASMAAIVPKREATNQPLKTWTWVGLGVVAASRNSDSDFAQETPFCVEGQVSFTNGSLKRIDDMWQIDPETGDECHPIREDNRCSWGRHFVVQESLLRGDRFTRWRGTQGFCAGAASGRCWLLAGESTGLECFGIWRCRASMCCSRLAAILPKARRLVRPG